MKTALGNTGKQLDGLVKHVAKQVVKQPFEVLKNTTGSSSSDNTQVENRAMEDLEQGSSVAQNQTQGDSAGSNGDFAGFATKGDFDRYSELSGERDEIEVNMLRKKLHQEFGVETGMAKARVERQQVEDQEEKVEEREVEQAEFFEKEKEENKQVSLAKAATGAETRMGKKVMG